MTQDSKETNENFELSLDQAEAFGATTYSMNPLAAPPIEPGTILLGRFKVVELLGVGGMGSVYRIDHLLLKGQFALKCLNKFQEANASWRRFQNETKAAQLLDHPNHLKVFEFGLLESGQPFFLMDLVEGTTLADEIKRLGHLPVERAVSIFIQVAFAMGYAHERRIIHRDLKPSNIMLAAPKTELEAECVKVVDFGIAKLTGIEEFNQQTLTKTGEVFGSPFYMSPEQCMGLPVDNRSDLYSLGCVFYETLTSAPPFMGENALSTMMKHQTELQLPLKEASLGLSYPAALEAIISKLLEKDPAKRYQSAAPLAGDLIALERALREQKQAVSGPSTFVPSQPKANAQSSGVTLYANLKLASVFAIFGLAMYFFGTLTGNHWKKDTGKVAQAPAIIIERQYWSEIEGNKKVFYFPPFPLGCLLAADGRSALAEDRVQVPLTMQTGLICGKGLFENPKLLLRFRPEEVMVLDVFPKEANPSAFPDFKCFTELRCLNVSGTAFSDKHLDLLRSLKKLVYLNLSTCDVDIDSLLKYEGIYKLNCLDGSHLNRTEAVLSNLHKFPKLRFLALSTSALFDADMKPLAKNTTLRCLCLSKNSITDQGISELAKMKNLQWLDISQNPFTPNCSKSLKLMTNLKKLEIGPVPWSQAVVDKFTQEVKSNNPELELVFKDQTTFDPSLMDGFAWQGAGLIAHPNLGRIIPE